MKRAILLCLIVCFPPPFAFAQAKPKPPAPCKVYFIPVETDEVTAGLHMAGLNKPQSSWYRKHGNQGKFAGICYLNLLPEGKSQMTIEELLDYMKNNPISIPSAPIYFIRWGETLVGEPYVSSYTTHEDQTVVTNNGGNISTGTVSVPVQHVASGVKRYYLASGVLDCWDRATGTSMPVQPLHSRGTHAIARALTLGWNQFWYSASTSLLKDGLEAIKKAEQQPSGK